MNLPDLKYEVELECNVINTQAQSFTISIISNEIGQRRLIRFRDRFGYGSGYRINFSIFYRASAYCC